MATKQDIEIIKGRTGTIIDTVTGVASWDGVSAKMFIAREYEGTPILTLDGTIDEGNNKISFSYVADDTEELPAASYYYEIVIFKADRSYIKTVTTGILSLIKPVKVDPTATT